MKATLIFIVTLLLVISATTLKMARTSITMIDEDEAFLTPPPNSNSDKDWDEWRKIKFPNQPPHRHHNHH